MLHVHNPNAYSVRNGYFPVFEFNSAFLTNVQKSRNSHDRRGTLKILRDSFDPFLFRSPLISTASHHILGITNINGQPFKKLNGDRCDVHLLFALVQWNSWDD